VLRTLVWTRAMAPRYQPLTKRCRVLATVAFYEIYSGTGYLELAYAL
jgi:hypothetical protein